MPDFWDKLFKTNLGPLDPSFAIHGFTSYLILYAQGHVTKPEIIAGLTDSDGNTMTVSEQLQAVIVTDAIDGEPNNQKVDYALRVNAAAMLAELGMVTKAEAKTLAGV